MKKLLIKSLILAYIIIWAIPVYAETLWMRHGLATGANDGSSYADAFQGPDSLTGNWGAGAGAIGAGDTLMVCDGTYDDIILVGASGTLGSEIVFDGDCSSVDAGYTDGTMGRIAPENVAIGSTYGYATNFSVKDDEHIIIQNLTFTDIFGGDGRLQTSFDNKSWCWTHEGGQSATVFTDNTFPTCIPGDSRCQCSGGAAIETDALIGGVIWIDDAGNNVLDCYAVITDNTSTTVTVSALAGAGCDGYFDNGDEAKLIADGSAIKAWGDTNFLTIQNCSFTQADTGTGFAIYSETMLSESNSIHDISIKNNTFTGGTDKEDTIYMRMGYQNKDTDLVEIYNITVENNVATGQYKFLSLRLGASEKDNMDVDGCRDWCTAAGTPWTNCTGAATGPLVSTDCGRDDIDKLFHDLIFRGNQIEMRDAAYVTLEIFALGRPENWSNNLIENNTVTWASGAEAVDDTNVFQLNFIKDTIVQNNNIQAPKLPAIAVGDGAGIIIDWGHDPAGNGDSDYNSDDVIVRNNTIRVLNSDHNQGKGISVYRGTDVEVYNNLITLDDAGAGIKLSSASDNLSTGMEVYNNTIIDGTDGIYVESTVPSGLIKNNLISGPSDDGIDDNSGNTTASYNLIYNEGGTVCEGITCTNTVTSDPLLTSAYKPTASSPAIDAGVSWTGWEPYYDGTLPDIGRYQWVTKGVNGMAITGKMQ